MGIRYNHLQKLWLHTEDLHHMYLVRTPTEAPPLKEELWVICVYEESHYPLKMRQLESCLHPSVRPHAYGQHYCESGAINSNKTRQYEVGGDWVRMLETLEGAVVVDGYYQNTFSKFMEFSKKKYSI